jgi:hypothetical protein
MIWIKERWYWLLAGLGAVMAFVAAVVFNRRGGQVVTPERPVLPDIVVGDKPAVNTNPADDYAEKAKDVDDQFRDRVSDANKRYS